MAQEVTTKPEVAEVVATEQAATPTSAPKKRKTKRSVPVGQVHILATFNNTIVFSCRCFLGSLVTACSPFC